MHRCLDPIQAEVDEAGKVNWEVADPGGNRRLFRRKPGSEFGAAMAQALNTLLGVISR